MVSIFIFCDKSNFIETLSSTILERYNNIKFKGTYKDISEESIKKCILSHPNVIIAEENTHKKLSSMLDFDYISITIPQIDQSGIEKICNQVNKFTLDSRYSHKLYLYNYRRYLCKKLQNLEFNTNLCGTQYLLDCLTYIHENPHYNINNSNNKNLFLLLAKKYNTNIQTINWNLHTCIEEMCKCTSSEFRRELYGIDFGLTIHTILRTLAFMY